MTPDSLRIEFTNYERTVWVVNSVEGHLVKYYSDLLICFDRFPEFPREGLDPLTPDFTVSFIGDYHLIGEIKRALGGSEKAVEETFEQIADYAQTLRFKTVAGGAHDHEVERHDIIVFVNLEHARKEARKLRQLVLAARERGEFGSAIAVFSATYDSQQAKARWIFECVNEESDRLTDDALPEERRLSKRHQDDANTIVVYPDQFTAIQAVHHFCNDNPPAIYTAVILWSRVFPRLIPAEDRARWTLEENNRGVIELKTSMDEVVKMLERLRIGVRKKHIRNAVDLLATASLVIKHDAGNLTIGFRKFRATQAEGEEKDEEIALDYTREGIINAVVKAQPKASAAAVRGSKPKKVNSSPDQLPLL